MFDINSTDIQAKDNPATSISYMLHTLAPYTLVITDTVLFAISLYYIIPWVPNVHICNATYSSPPFIHNCTLTLHLQILHVHVHFHFRMDVFLVSVADYKVWMTIDPIRYIMFSPFCLGYIGGWKPGASPSPGKTSDVDGANGIVPVTGEPGPMVIPVIPVTEGSVSIDIVGDTLSKSYKERFTQVKKMI